MPPLQPLPALDGLIVCRQDKKEKRHGTSVRSCSGLGHKNEIAAVTEEMTLTVYQTGRSGMRKVGDFATTVCDSQGRIVGEGDSPYHKKAPARGPPRVSY